jgi:hypothetical protein
MNEKKKCQNLEVTCPLTHRKYHISYGENGDGVLLKPGNDKVGAKVKPTAIYIKEQDATFIIQHKEKIKLSDGDELARAFIGGFSYTYALIDPSTQQPFYIGKGVQNRIADHFVAGIDSDEVCEQLDEQTKLGKMKQLLQRYEKKDIARIVARFVDEKSAFDIESLLIHHVYDKSQLTNKQSGHQKDNFRPHNNWNYKEGFDLEVNDEGEFIGLSSGRKKQHYIYALVDPCDNTLFYIGKGSGTRIQDHFNDVRFAKKQTNKIEKLKLLLDDGRAPKEIGRVIAYTDSPVSALLMESFYIKFVARQDSDITNAVGGHYNDRFRGKDDWSIRNGFDLPLIIAKGSPRVDLYDQFMGLQLDDTLLSVIKVLRQYGAKYELNFEDFKVANAGELALIAPINERGKLKIFVRSGTTRKVAVELRPVKRKITKDYFERVLNRKNVLRGDDVLLPLCWRRQTTNDPVEVAKRAKMLIDLMHFNNSDEVTPELELLLQERP